jgi:hypothetical protein
MKKTFKKWRRRSLKSRTRPKKQAKTALKTKKLNRMMPLHRLRKKVR